MLLAVRSPAVFFITVALLACAVVTTIEPAGAFAPRGSEVENCNGCGGAGMQYACPSLCDHAATVGHEDLLRQVWLWDNPPPTGRRDDYSHEMPNISRPKDLLPVHRLFIHGLHGDRTSWDDWVREVKTLIRGTSITYADETGVTSFGPGSASLLTQATELATQINSVFASAADDSVYVYAHSLGGLKIQAVLQLGRGGQQPFATAAAKIHRVNIFQGAHGGCKATSALGDFGTHGANSCHASQDIGWVNEARQVLKDDIIPGTPLSAQEIWDLAKITWMGTAHPKTIRYYQMYAHNGAPKGPCLGALGYATSWVCDEDESDGVVYKKMHVPTWWKNYAAALQAGLVVVVDDPGNHCHMRKDNGNDDTYVDPKHDVLGVFPSVIERDPTFVYLTGIAGHFEHPWVNTTPAYCAPACYCSFHAVDDKAYCAGPSPVGPGPKFTQ